MGGDTGFPYNHVAGHSKLRHEYSASVYISDLTWPDDRRRFNILANTAAT